MKLNSFSLAALVVFLLFGGIGISAAMNWWQTESTKTAATFTEGEFAGQANPADIRGSYTFGDVNKNFGVPLEDLKIAFRLPADADPALFPVKELEVISTELPVEVGTASVRMFVAFYKGLPYDLVAAEESYLFPESEPILKAQNKMLPGQAEFLATHLVPDAPVDGAALEPALTSTLAAADSQSTPTPAAAVAGQVTPTPAATEHIQTDKTVSGSTTFQSLLDWGVSQETIEKVISDKMPAASTVIKNYATAKGLEFSTLKTPLQAEVDKTK
jgi:hypothetical protein